MVSRRSAKICRCACPSNFTLERDAVRGRISGLFYTTYNPVWGFGGQNTAGVILTLSYDELREVFRQWYPNFDQGDEDQKLAA